MAKENIIDSWKWVTDSEPTFRLDFGGEEVFSPNVNKKKKYLPLNKKHSLEAKTIINCSVATFE